MSFREKSAWVTLIAFVIASVMYIIHAGPRMLVPNPGVWTLHLIGVSIAAFILIEVIAHIVLWVRFPKDARTPRDERERLIELKATRLAAYVYVLLTFVVISAAPIHGADGFGVGLGVLLGFVIAEIVNYAARIIYYRRGV
jgi:hypothetical protein